MMQDNYTYKQIIPERLNDVKFIFQNISGIKTPITFFEKKYNTTVFGEYAIGYLAYTHDGTPAAYYGVFPCLVEFQGKKILAAQSGDTMTHPLHQGKGLFTKLAKMTYELAKKEGVEFIFGFPNKNSYPGFVKKLNWVHKENIRTYRIKISTIPFAKAMKKMKMNNVYNVFCKAIFK